ncbi:hypothetical protein EVAR_12675_1 [Eumeta japonica]|uniref:Uncharacterized protein n=1 Tax=Eumeta variegata TaxID=151549 RepID=A0A4C1YVG7_EUMVA|nr:hypothetical protein EVAR_12675_1 [Eumeta japonica]
MPYEIGYHEIRISRCDKVSISPGAEPWSKRRAGAPQAAAGAPAAGLAAPAGQSPLARAASRRRCGRRAHLLRHRQWAHAPQNQSPTT